MKYKIEVHSTGYDDHEKIIEAPSMQKASTGFNVRSAIIEWCDNNNIDLDDDNFKLPFTRITRIS